MCPLLQGSPLTSCELYILYALRIKDLKVSLFCKHVTTQNAEKGISASNILSRFSHGIEIIERTGGFLSICIVKLYNKDNNDIVF